MGFRLEIWTWRLFVASVALAAVCSAVAQPESRRPGEAILFSSPAGDEVNSNVPSLAAKPPVLLNPMPVAQMQTMDPSASPQTGPLSPPPMFPPAQSQQMQRQLDEQKNWALMTPEQILGVPTLDKILGVQKRDGFGRPKNGTVVDQFYERQEQSRARTNNYDAADSAPRWAQSDSGSPLWKSKLLNPASTGPGNSTLMDQFMKGTSDNSAESSAAAVPADGWFRTFGSPAPPARLASGQQASSEQIRPLFQSLSPSGEAIKVSAFDGPMFSTRPATHSSASRQATPPIGESYAPLNSGIGMPVGVAPLPGLLGPTNKLLLAPPLDWKPESAPWLSPTPQLGVAPQRKF